MSASVTDRTTPASPGPPPAMTPRELARWAWRQLTSMRTALLLLLLLALGSVPGSVIPQSNIAAVQVSRWKEQHPTLTPIYEKLGLFSVYDSVWFSAIYILLTVSLVGCIVPRLAVHWRAVRAAPPGVPRNLHRLPAYQRVGLGTTLTLEAEQSLVAEMRSRLRRRRYRVTEAGSSLSAERGHLREAGNLLFHISVVVVLLGFAFGQLFGFKGGSIVVVGGGFSNSLPQYDDFAPGSLFDPGDLKPLSLTVDDFDVKFIDTGPQAGQPEYFRAEVSYRENLDSPEQHKLLEVNSPLVLDGVSVFLVGHGYAPSITVTDGSGEVAYDGPAVFLPQDSSFASFGVLKVPGAEPEQLGFDGLFLPTYGFDMERGPFSTFPDARNPVLTLLGYHGDLGMDAGEPQSVYELDTDRMEKFTKDDGSDFRLDLAPGRTVQLPDGLGSVRFNGWERWVKLQVSDTPGKGVTLGGIVLALVGLMGSLFIRRRRLWVRVVPGRAGSGDAAYVEVAGLDRSTVAVGLEDEVREVAELVALAQGLDTGLDTGPDRTRSTTEDTEETP